MDFLTFERIVWVHVVEDAFVKLWSNNNNNKDFILTIEKKAFVARS